MADDVRLWMVERSDDARNLITVVYATTEGDRYHRKELSASMLSRTETTRMAESHAPDQAV